MRACLGRPLPTFLVAAVLAAAVPAAAQTLDPWVVGNGAVSAARNEMSLTATVGQPFAETVSRTTRTAEMGFWYQIGAAGGTTTAIPLPDPGRTVLHQNAPNPFNPSTAITFELAREGRTSLALYDLRGREVAVLVDAVLPAGVHVATFRPRNLASGVYLYRLRTPDTVLTRRLMLTK